MKAKMPAKPAEKATYLCNKCNKQFQFASGDLKCPSCGNQNKTDLVIIYIKDDPKEEHLYTKDDFVGGD
jgi:phage FluMu protein Com